MYYFILFQDVFVDMWRPLSTKFFGYFLLLYFDMIDKVFLVLLGQAAYKEVGHCIVKALKQGFVLCYFLLLLLLFACFVLIY